MITAKEIETDIIGRIKIGNREITETVSWSKKSVRGAVIEGRLLPNASTEEMEAIDEFVVNHTPTTQNIFALAQFMCERSNRDDNSDLEYAVNRLHKAVYHDFQIATETEVDEKELSLDFPLFVPERYRSFCRGEEK